MATATKKAAPKKSAAPAEGAEKKKDYIRRSPAEVLQNRLRDLEAFDQKYLADRAKRVALIEKLQNRVSTPIVSEQEVAAVVAEGKTPEQLKAEIKRLMAIQKKLANMTPEEQAELLASVEAPAEGEPSSDEDMTEV